MIGFIALGLRYGALPGFLGWGCWGSTSCLALGAQIFCINGNPSPDENPLDAYWAFAGPMWRRANWGLMFILTGTFVGAEVLKIGRSKAFVGTFLVALLVGPSPEKKNPPRSGQESR